MALLHILLCLCQCHVAQVLLIGLAPVDGNLLHLGQDDQRVGAQFFSQQFRCEVLVDNRSSTLQGAVCILDNGDTAAATGDHDGIVEQLLDFTDLHNLLGDGRSNHTTPAAAGIFLHGVALGCCQLLSLFPGVECTDGLGRLLESRVGSVHDHLSQQGDHGHIQIPLGQGLAQGLLNVVTDITLAHGTADIKRHHGDHIFCSLAGQNDTANLRTVAMDHGQLIAACAELSHVFAGLLHNFQLGLSSGRAVLGLQGVAAQRDDDLGHGSILLFGVGAD